MAYQQRNMDTLPNGPISWANGCRLSDNSAERRCVKCGRIPVVAHGQIVDDDEPDEPRVHCHAFCKRCASTPAKWRMRDETTYVPDAPDPSRCSKSTQSLILPDAFSGRFLIRATPKPAM